MNTLKLGPGQNQYFGRNSIWSSELGDDRLAKRMRALSRLFDLSHQFEGYQSLYIFPFTMISSTFGFSQSVQHFLPSATPNKSFFTSRLFTGLLKDSVKEELISSFMASSATMNRLVFDEDHQICKRVDVDTWSMQPPRFWSASEEKILHFRKSYSETVRAD